jgi:uncharacterized tellurite resistance protein B-like protein
MEEKKSIISELIELSKVDGEVSQNEIGLIKQVGNMIGLQDGEILELFKNPVKFNPESSHLDRIVQFQRLVLLANVDEKIAEEEIDRLKKMGLRLGLNAKAVEEVLERMNDYPNNVIPPNELLNIYKKHMN